jgi:hypothetical protein
MNKGLAFAIALLVFTFTACDKKPAARQPISPSAPSAPAAPEPDISKTLDRLTQAVRKYAAETRSEPKSLNDLVAAGYLSELPEAPAGKKFVIDGNLRVQLQ